MTMSRAFAEWGLSLANAPDEVRGTARRHMLDAIGNALAARRLGTVDFVVEEALAYTAPAVSSILGAAAKVVPPPMAALANGALVHALDFDDTHAGALIHGTAATLPAALAMGQARNATFGQVVDALIVGIEVTMRIGRIVPHGFHSRGFHPTSVVGVFGATLAAGRLAGLDADTTVNALGLAGSMASGSLEFLQTGSSTKQIHPGWAGLAALTSVGLARRGATGPDSILEGKYGLFQSYLGTEVDVPAALSDLGTLWETARMTMKPYPVCQLSHASLDAAARLLDRPGATSIESIEIRLPEESIPVVTEPREKKHRPRSPYEAKFSVQWDVAALLIDGSLRVDHFASDQLDRADIADLAARVVVVPVPFDGVPADAPGEVTLTSTTGDVVTERVEASGGSPRNPMSDADIVGKFRMNVGHSIPDPLSAATAILKGDLVDLDELFAITEMK